MDTLEHAYWKPYSTKGERGKIYNSELKLIITEKKIPRNIKSIFLSVYLSKSHETDLTNNENTKMKQNSANF